MAVPTRVRGGLENDRVVHVRIGNGFTAVLTATGRVWTLRRGKSGQLGTGVMDLDGVGIEKSIMVWTGDNKLYSDRRVSCTPKDL